MALGRSALSELPTVAGLTAVGASWMDRSLAETLDRHSSAAPARRSATPQTPTIVPRLMISLATLFAPPMGRYSASIGPPAASMLGRVEAGLNYEATLDLPARERALGCADQPLHRGQPQSGVTRRRSGAQLVKGADRMLPFLNADPLTAVFHTDQQFTLPQQGADCHRCPPMFERILDEIDHHASNRLHRQQTGSGGIQLHIQFSRPQVVAERVPDNLVCNGVRRRLPVSGTH